MAWLVTHMWMVLAGATVFALLLGWSVRGMLLTGKMRKAIVDKDIALTELDQARDEIERLFAAQRAQRGEGGNVADASARKISDLTSELQKAKTELAALKTETAKTGAAEPASTGAKGEMPTIVLPPNRGGADDTPGQSAEAGAASAKGDENEAEAPTLIWRNRHLEARVQHLESQLAAVEAAPASAPATVESAEPVAVAEPTADEAGLDKLRWQADYLKQRVEALEAELAKAPAETPIVAEDDLNEEMARLRWRNRFLEGRLAYFEGGAEEAAAETPAQEEAVPVYHEVEDTAVEEAAFDALPEPEAIVEEEMAVEKEVIIEDELEDVSEEEAVEPEEASFEDVSNDEEESLAEADHADEDTLSDEEYDEEDFVEADADETEDEYGDAYDEEDSEEQEESYDEDSSEEDDESDDDESYEDDAEAEFEDEAGEDDFEDDEDEAYDDDDAEEYDDSEDDYEADADDEDESDEDDGEADEAWADADDSEDETDDESDDEEDTDDADVSYQTEVTVLKERPMAMNGPVEGHPDDLTLIGGIGPKIQILLNELGVWHFDQIAEWTPENVAWMDEHLNFGGRIAREGWVEQAAVLVRDAESV
ncbi:MULTISPECIES: hypothetical protein [unclassified Hyphomonas]|uniref:hypothetical protein n=1 Tax=unclassified Hyphomonas TaxID=2630699 RepID=UPI00080767E9|nr:MULTISPECIES: hypothetical protein [unclassified Hyphomonas]